MKKRLFLIVASAMLALSLGACKTNKADSSSSGNSSGNSSSGSVISSGSSSASDSSSSSSEDPQFADTDYTVKINSGDAIRFTTQGEEEIKDGEQQKIGVQYQHALTVAAGDVLTFFKQGSPITPYAGGEAPANNVACNLNTMELTVVKAATATCYFKAYDNGTYDLWLTGNEGGTGGGNYTPGSLPTDTAYTVKVNDGAAITFTTAGQEDIPGGVQYQHALNVQAGDTLTFFNNGEQIYPHAGDSEPSNNASYNTSTKAMTVVETNPEAMCYFKVYTDSYQIWLTGNTSGTGGGNYTPAGSANWAFASSTNEWSTTAEPLTQDTADMPAGVKDQYSLLDHDLALNEEFKITDGTEWYGFEHLETNTNFEGADSMGDKNIKTLVAGTYDIFLKIKDDDSISIYIAEDGGVLPPPANDCFLSGTFNSWTTTADPMYTLNDNSTTDPALDFEYAIEGLALAADTEFKVIYGENTYGFSIYEGKGTNAVEGTNGAFLLEQSATYSIYFKVYTNGNFGVWINSDIVVPPHGPDGSTLVDWWLVGDGSIFTSDWSTAGGIQLYSNPSNLEDKGCILSVTLAVDDLFKVTDGETWFGYDKVQTWDDPSNAGIHCFIGEDDGFDGLNFKCTVAGTYDIYVEKSGSFWIGYAA